MGFKSGIEQLEESLRHCTRCGGCLEVCPSFQATGDEAQSARGRVTLLMALAQGRLGFTSGLARRLSTCLDCGACAGSCPAGVGLPEAIHAVRKELAGGRRTERLKQLLASHLAVADGPTPTALRLAAALDSALSSGIRRGPPGSHRLLPRVHGVSLSQRLPELSRSHSPQTRVLFFPGCAANMMNPETGLAAVRVMNAAGADVITPRGLSCCGQPLKSLGNPDAAASMLRANLRVMAGLDADAIVTICATCAFRLRSGLPRLEGVERSLAESLAAKSMDIHQWLAERPLPELMGDQTLTVTWHDPCHMRWMLGLVEEPRGVIKALPGVEYVETSRPGACCGGGGLFGLLHGDLARKIGRERAAPITGAGADIVATGCPSCQAQLTEVLARTGAPTRVVHTVELIAAALPPQRPVGMGAG